MDRRIRAALLFLLLITFNVPPTASLPRIAHQGNSQYLSFGQTEGTRRHEPRTWSWYQIWRPLASWHSKHTWIKRAIPTSSDLGSGVDVPPPQPQDPTQPLNTTSESTSGAAPGAIGNSYPIINTSDGIDCWNLSTGLSTKCWHELNLTGYLLDWQAKTHCNSSTDFARCFLRESNYSIWHCEYMTSNLCPPPPSSLPESLADPKRYYIIFNIYSINNFFLNYYQAVVDGAATAELQINYIVQILDPNKALNMDLNIMFIVFQSVFSLIPGALGIAWAGSHIAWQAAAQAVANALVVAPVVGRYLFPTGNEESRVVQSAKLGQEFANLTVNLESNLNQTFHIVMNNASNFLAFAQQGVFCKTFADLAGDAHYLHYAFTTYVVSQAMVGNNIYAVVARDTNPQQLATNGTKLAYDIDCKTYDEQGVCDAWWYSKNYKSAFTLDNFSQMYRNYNKELKQLLSNVTTGELLFENALACHLQGQAGAPVNLTVFAGGLNAACLSQLPILTWDMSCHAPGTNDPKPHTSECEFLERAKQDRFFDQGVRTQQRRYANVPAGYLGPAINGGGITRNKGW